MKQLNFYGVCDTAFKLGDVVWLAVEDPDDGWRSMLEEIKQVQDDSCYTFSRVPLAIVSVHKDEDFYRFIDSTGHVWLTIGTDNADDWYPCFVFRYTPPQEGTTLPEPVEQEAGSSPFDGFIS